MASSNYTTNLSLCAWTENDRPKRADFVSDNAPFVLKTYSGSGESSRTIILDFAPKLVIIYKRNTPPVMVENGVTVVNCGCSGYGASGTGGVSISGSNVTVSETAATSGSRISLNSSGSQYTVIAFR